MDTQHLKTFVTVAKLASFTDAAEQLHLTQPAISKRIATLESQLSCQLFDRLGRSVHLTQAGLELLPRAEAILDKVSDTQLAIANLAGNIAGSLKVVTSHHIGLHHLPKILKTFTQRYPAVQLELEFMDSEKAYAAIYRGEAELALATLDKAQTTNLNTRVLWPDPLSFVVSEEHHLAQLGHPALLDLSQYPAILPGISIHTKLVDELFQHHKLALNRTMATNYLETIKMMVSIGLGWSLLPNTMLDSGLKAVPLKKVELSRDLGCIQHCQRTLSNAAKAFLEILDDSRHS